MVSLVLFVSILIYWNLGKYCVGIFILVIKLNMIVDINFSVF